MTQPAAPQANLRIAISGASGFLGSALMARLQREHITIQRLRRAEREGVGPSDIAWQPNTGQIDLASLDGVNAVINLSGEQIAQRWTAKRKRAIRDSRVDSTTLLARSIETLPHPPRVFVSGSAIGIYGDRGDEELDEESQLGSDFLAEVAEAWEQSTEPARAAGIRVVLIRTGVVLSPNGGALARMLPFFKLGLGGKIGSGAQWMSWIGLRDWLSAVELALATEISGPLNLVAPNPVTNEEFARTLGRVVGRPAIVPVPELAVNFVFGEMGRATLLASQRIRPRRLLEAGFEFAHPTLEQALRAERGLDDDVPAPS